MASIGKKLSKVRKEKGLSVEDVAHSTHIHANIIHKIEEDDFSNFASTSYAKSFLKQYGSYLEVDVKDAVTALDRGTAEIIERPGVETMVGGIKQRIERSNSIRPARTKRARRPRVEKPGGAPVFLSFILVVLILSIGVFYYLGYQASSSEEFQNKLEESIAKTGLISETQNGSDLAASDPKKSTIERNPLKVETPASGGTHSPSSRSDELLSVDFDTDTTGKPKVSAPNLPKPAQTDHPAKLRPAGTDPVGKRPEQAIIRAIPVPEPRQPPSVSGN